MWNDAKTIVSVLPLDAHLYHIGAAGDDATNMRAVAKRLGEELHVGLPISPACQAERMSQRGYAPAAAGPIFLRDSLEPDKKSLHHSMSSSALTPLADSDVKAARRLSVGFGSISDREALHPEVPVIVVASEMAPWSRTGGRHRFI